VSEDRLAALEARLAQLQSDYDAMHSALEEQLGINDKLAEQVKTLAPFQQTAEDLGGKLRGLTHERAYEKLAEDLKIKPEFRGDVWKLAGYEAKQDEPDEKGMREHLGKWLEERGHYVDQGDGKSNAAEGESKPAAKLPKGEGASRGSSRSSGDGKRKLTPETLRDPDKMTQFMKEIAKSGEGVDAFDLVEA
jgi:hypothetical protein